MMLRLLVITGVLISAPICLASDSRIWTDSSGKHSVEAEFVQIKKDNVVLRRTDSRRAVEIPLDRLSKADQEHARIQGLEQRAQKQRTARHAVELYDAFLAHPELSEMGKAIVSERLARWTGRADNKVIRVGDQWLPLSDAEKIEAEADLRIKEAFRGFDVGDVDGALDKLKQASKKNLESITADFWLGLYFSQIARDAARARRHFRVCVVRRLRNRPLLHPTERANLIGAINNLGLVEIRSRRYGTAVSYFRRAVEIGPVTSEVVHNIGRFSSLPRLAQHIGLPSAAVSNVRELYVGLARETKATIFDTKIGWLYMMLLDEPPFREWLDGRGVGPLPPDRIVPKEDMILSGSGSGFVVQRGYILTNKHVVEGGDYFEIAKEGDNFPAELVAQSPTVDLAILKCEGLKVGPLHLAAEVPRLGTEVAVLGYPEVDKLGSTLKVTRGGVVGLPSPSLEDQLLVDAIINHGNSGGPICDNRGYVIAVASWGRKLELGNLYGGVTSKRAADFVREHVPMTSFSPPVASDASWPEIVAVVAPATIRIKVYQCASSLELVRKFSDSSNLWEDRWCMSCYGSKRLKCRVPKCRKGKVQYRVPQFVDVKNRQGIIVGQRYIGFDLFAYRPCPTCLGAGKVECPHCVRGIDPSLAE